MKPVNARIAKLVELIYEKCSTPFCQRRTQIICWSCGRTCEYPQINRVCLLAGERLLNTAVFVLIKICFFFLAFLLFADVLRLFDWSQIRSRNSEHFCQEIGVFHSLCDLSYILVNLIQSRDSYLEIRLIGTINQPPVLEVNTQSISRSSKSQFLEFSTMSPQEESLF